MLYMQLSIWSQSAAAISVRHVDVVLEPITGKLSVQMYVPRSATEFSTTFQHNLWLHYTLYAVRPKAQHSLEAPPAGRLC